LTISEQ